MALQSVFDRLHRGLAECNALVIDLAAEFDDRMDTLPRHTLSPLQHRLDIKQLRPIPVQFQDPPATLDGIIFAVVGWIIKQLDGLADIVGKLDHTMQKLCASPTALRAVVHFDLEQTRGCLDVLIPGSPLGFEHIDDEVTRFVRTAKRHTELPGIFIHDSTRNIVLLAPQVVVTRVGITPGETTARKIADVHRGFTIDTQAFDVLRYRCVGIFFLMLSKMASVSGIFFWGLAFTTLRRRKPRRLSTVAIVLGAGSCAAG